MTALKLPLTRMVSRSLRSSLLVILAISSSRLSRASDDAVNDDLDPLLALNIPKDHLPYFLNSHPHLKDLYCSSPSATAASMCHVAANDGPCWGYEPGCSDPAKRFLPPPVCEGGSRSWAQDKEDQRRQFFEHVSFA